MKIPKKILSNGSNIIVILTKYLKLTLNKLLNSDKMNITKTYNGQELTVKVESRIDTVTAPDFENEINDEMGKFDSLIVDFSDLEYISSAGLRVLIATQKKLNPENIPMTIKNVNDTISEIFRMSGFDKILKIE